jgi:hypothetical protein
MNGSDQRLSVMHRKGIHLRSISLVQTGTAQAAGWIFLEGPISISEIKGTSENADADLLVDFRSS